MRFSSHILGETVPGLHAKSPNGVIVTPSWKLILEFETALLIAAVKLVQEGESTLASRMATVCSPKPELREFHLLAPFKLLANKTQLSARGTGGGKGYANAAKQSGQPA